MRNSREYSPLAMDLPLASRKISTWRQRDHLCDAKATQRGFDVAPAHRVRQQERQVAFNGLVA